MTRILTPLKPHETKQVSGAMRIRDLARAAKSLAAAVKKRFAMADSLFLQRRNHCNRKGASHE